VRDGQIAAGDSTEESVSLVADRARRRLAGTAVIWLLSIAGLTAFFYLLGRRVLTGDSDSATVVLQAQSINAGHVTLSGWRTLYDSFWTVDAPLYAVGVRLIGVTPRLMYLVPAFLGAVVVAFGAWLARGRRGGVAGLAAVATVIVLVALPNQVLAAWFLHGALHVGTVLWVLVAFTCLRNGQWGWRWACAVGFLTAGLLGDLLTLPLGLVPAFVAGLAAMLRTRNWRAGLPAVSAAIASGLLALTVRRLAVLVGTFAIGRANPRADLDQQAANLGHVPERLSWLFGMRDIPGTDSHVPSVLLSVHVVGLVAVAVAVVVGLAALGSGARVGHARGRTVDDSWHLDDMLTLACLGSVAVFAALAFDDNPAFVRYLTPVVMFGAILAGRMIGRLVESLRRVSLRRAGAAIGGAVVAAYAATSGVVAGQPAQPVTGVDLARFLDAHDLRDGVGSYWVASITTVASGGKVAVRPVIGDDGGTIVRYDLQSSADWYAGHAFQFLVYDQALPWKGVNAATAVANFGPVARTYAVGTLRVLVWSHPISVGSTR
jgi:hypothetical protein